MYTPGATWKNLSGLFAHVYGGSGIGAGQATEYETESLPEHGKRRRVLQVVAWGQTLLGRCMADLHASSTCIFCWRLKRAFYWRGESRTMMTALAGEDRVDFTGGLLYCDRAAFVVA